MSKLSMITNLWRNKSEYENIFTAEKLSAYTRMIPKVLKGEYKPQKKRNLYLGIAALAYVISPIDIIPEFLAGPFGLLDDLAIVLFAIRKLDTEVTNFLQWEANSNSATLID